MSPIIRAVIIDDAYERRACRRWHMSWTHEQPVTISQEDGAPLSNGPRGRAIDSLT